MYCSSRISRTFLLILVGIRSLTALREVLSVISPLKVFFIEYASASMPGISDTNLKGLKLESSLRSLETTMALVSLIGIEQSK